MKKRSVSTVTILIYLILFSVIVFMLWNVTHRHISFFKESIKEINHAGKIYIYCLSKCSLPSTAICAYDDRKYPCYMFSDITSKSTHWQKHNTLLEMGIKKDILTTQEEKCKIVDILNPPSKEMRDSLRKVLKRSVEKYNKYVNEISSKENIDPCILYTIIAVESSGGEVKHTADYTSCGITMITPENLKEMNYCDNNAECCEKIMNDDKKAIEISAKLFKEFEKITAKYIIAYHYPTDKQHILRMAYIFAYYNGGHECFQPSKSCSFDICHNLKTSFKDSEHIPVFLCSYDIGGCKETQQHVIKSLYVYTLCKLKQF